MSKRKVEWSFDFEDIGKQVGQFFKNMKEEGEVELETAHLTAPLDDAESAQVNVDFSVGKASAKALPADSDNLFEARITYVGEYEFEVSGESERSVSLRQKGSFPNKIARLISHAKSLEWDIALAQNIPHRLHLKGGLGETDINLTGLLVEAIKLDTGVGKVALTLPSQEVDFDASINGGVGKTDVTLPAGAGGRLKIDGGVGEVNILAAPTVDMRIKANSGLGQISLPETLTRAGDVWETPDFADASKPILIDYNGGVGSFRLKFFDVL